MMMDKGPVSDEALALMFREGDEGAFRLLYDRYERKLKRLIYGIAPASDVEDIFHETILKVVRYIDRYDERRPFGGWIYRIALNCGRNYRKSARRESDAVEQVRYRIREEDEHATPEERLIDEEDMREFNAAVASLKDRFREVFLLRYGEGMKYSLIAEVLGCSERTAKWRMEKAVEMITLTLKKRGVI